MRYSLRWLYLGLLSWACWGGLGCEEARDQTDLVRLYQTPLLMPALTEEPDPASALAQGLAAIQNQEFEKGQALLIQVEASDPRYWQARYYLGACLLWQKEYNTASQVLEEAKTNLSGSWREAAQWYLGLSLLAQDLPDVACTWLDPDGYQHWPEMKGRIRELHRRVCR